MPALAGAGAATALQGPRWPRAAMAGAEDPAPWHVVYGTRDAATAPALRARAQWLARTVLGGDSARVAADADVREADLAAGPLVLVGGPRENAWTARAAAVLPVRFTPAGFQWAATAYERPGDALTLAWPNPWAPRHLALVVAGNSPAALAGHAGLLGGDDWRIERAGERVRAGRFAQGAAAPWHYEPALDHDREAGRASYERSLRVLAAGPLAVRVPPGLAGDEAAASGRVLLARMDALGLSAPGRPVRLTLYRSLEQKAELTRSPRAEHVDDAGAAHAALLAGRESLDLWSVAAVRLVQLGGARSSRLLEPAGAWLADRCEGEPLARAVSRAYFGRVLPVASAAASRAGVWRSPLAWTPAQALLVRAVWESAPPLARRPALLALLRHDPPGTLDSLCARAGVPAAAVEKRYRQLADSLAHAAQRELSRHRAAPWTPAAGFQRGVWLSHVLELDAGYASAACARELANLHAAGADWVVLAPYAYLPDPRRPELLPSAQGGADEETDEAVCEAAARAHALGMHVWLAPQLWTRDGQGALEFSPSGWDAFADRWGELLAHDAMLAEREGIDGLVVGDGLDASAVRQGARWRTLVADVRALYSGTLAYVAHAGAAGEVPFWDALDLIGVDLDTPLAARPTADPATLRAGAERALAALAPLARRSGRPVLLMAGWPALAGAAARPRALAGAAPDPEAQRACAHALREAADPCLWLAGVLWGRWPSGPTATEPAESPRARPAEAEVRAALRAAQGRPVRVPAR